MSKTDTVLNSLKPLSKADLHTIIDYRKISHADLLNDSGRSANLAKIVAEDVRYVGMRKLLDNLSKEVLTTLSEGLEYIQIYPNSKPSTKEMAKRVVDEMKEVGAKKFLQDKDETLDEIVEELELETSKSASAAQKIEVILKEGDEIGLENCFSAFSVDRLISFAENSKLPIKARGKDYLIQALSTRTPPKEVAKKKAPKREIAKPSEKKQDIKKGISAADLHQWYNRDELVKYCEDKSLPKAGNKKVLIQRILDHLAGKKIEVKSQGRKRKAAPTKKTGKEEGTPTKKARKN